MRTLMGRGTTIGSAWSGWVAIGLFVGAWTAQAQRYWDGEASPDPNWNTPANWSGNTLPTAGDDAYIGSATLGTAGAVIDTAGMLCQELRLGYDPATAIGTLTFNGGGLTGTGFSVGWNGTGTLTMASGTASFSGTIGYLGRGVGGAGSILLNGGRFLAPSAAVYAGQSAGSSADIRVSDGLFISSQLRLAAHGTSRGYLEVSGGVMSNAYLNIGRAGQGYFLKTGGTNYVTAGMSVTDDATGSGRVDIVAGRLDANGLNVGSAGANAQVYQSGGAVTVAGTLTVGGGYGYYEIGTGAVLTALNYQPAAGFGTFRQAGGAVRVTDFRMGAVNTGNYTGLYELVSGLLTNRNVFQIARYKTARFVQSGGTNTSPTCYVGYLADTGGNGARGAYDMRGGYWDCRGGLYAGADAKGVGLVSQSGGAIRMGGDIVLGNSAASVGQYSMSGGVLRVLANCTIGSSGQGSFLQTGGTNEWLRPSGSFGLGWNAGATGVYHLAGGTLAISNGTFYVPYNGSGTFLIGDADGTGTLNMRGNNCNLSIRHLTTAGAGIVRGWGSLPFTKIQNSGKVIADGYGQARDLDFTGSSQGVEENYRTPVAGGGWYAVNKGRLRIHRAANAATVIWADGAVQDLVNSVKFAFTGQSGTLNGELLATDREDVPYGIAPIAVWSFNGFNSFSTAVLTILYDEAAALARWGSEGDLKIYRYKGGHWENVTASRDAGSNLLVTRTLNVAEGALTYVAVGRPIYGSVVHIR